METFKDIENNTLFKLNSFIDRFSGLFSLIITLVIILGFILKNSL